MGQFDFTGIQFNAGQEEGCGFRPRLIGQFESDRCCIDCLLDFEFAFIGVGEFELAHFRQKIHHRLVDEPGFNQITV